MSECKLQGCTGFKKVRHLESVSVRSVCTHAQYICLSMCVCVYAHAGVLVHVCVCVCVQECVFCRQVWFHFLPQREKPGKPYRCLRKSMHHVPLHLVHSRKCMQGGERKGRGLGMCVCVRVCVFGAFLCKGSRGELDLINGGERCRGSTLTCSRRMLHNKGFENWKQNHGMMMMRIILL